MVKGKTIPVPIRKAIHKDITFNKLDLDVIQKKYKEYTSLNHLKKLRARFNKDEVASTLYTSNNPLALGIKHAGGRPKKYSNELDSLLLRLDNDTETLLTEEALGNEFASRYFDQRPDAPSKSQINRMLKRNNITTKVVDHRHIKRLIRQELIHRRIIEHVHEDFLIDIDEMSAGPKKFNKRMGRSVKGKRCYRRQIKIGTKYYCVIAAMGTKGFICWRIFEGTMKSDEFQKFLDETYELFHKEGHHGLFDNAKTHKTSEAIRRINMVFRGLFNFVPPYSPHLKPIERGFSMIRSYLRANSREAILNPIKVLNDAFHNYSTLGPSGYKCRKLFNSYKNNHLYFLDSLRN